MKEYEYSFIVNDLTPYIDFCKDECFEKTGESSQIRELFTNTNNVLARITTDNANGKQETFLDFKDDDDSDKTLKISRESIPLKITKENQSAINSMLEILGYKKKKHLVRKRQIYEKSNIKFEIDNYSSPEIMYVVAIEGEKELVDKTYEKLKQRVNN